MICGSELSFLFLQDLLGTIPLRIQMRDVARDTLQDAGIVVSSFRRPTSTLIQIVGQAESECHRYFEDPK